MAGFSLGAGASRGGVRSLRLRGDWVGRLAVIDITDPSNPEQVSGYRISGSATSVPVAGAYAYVAAGTIWAGEFDQLFFRRATPM
jgi:hypothetical protein